MRYAVASDFEGALGFFTGAIDAGNPGVGRRFIPQASPNRGEAFAVDDRQVAATIAVSLRELALCITPAEARTWFVYELPERAP